MRGVVDDLDRSVLSLRDAAQLEAGDVTIGCVFSAVHNFLPPVIHAFRARHPHVLVRIIEEGADEVLASVKHGEADFAINYIGMQDPEVEFTPLLKEPYVLACRADHPLARRRSVRWEELGDYPHARVSHASATACSSTRRSPTCRRCRGRSARCAMCRRSSAWWRTGSAWRWCRN